MKPVRLFLIALGPLVCEGLGIYLCWSASWRVGLGITLYWLSGLAGANAANKFRAAIAEGKAIADLTIKKDE